MMKFALLILLAALIMVALALVMVAVSMRMPTQRNSATPFECGFDPKNSARMPFSLRFFLLAIIFLIFDVEVALLLPILLIVNQASFVGVSTTMVFLAILLAGLLHEWREGSLNWV